MQLEKRPGTSLDDLYAVACRQHGSPFRADVRRVFAGLNDEQCDALNFEGIRFGNSHIAIFAALQVCAACRNLAYLSLKDTGINDAQLVIALDLLRHGNRLALLDISCNRKLTARCSKAITRFHRTQRNIERILTHNTFVPLRNAYAFSSERAVLRAAAVRPAVVEGHEAQLKAALQDLQAFDLSATHVRDLTPPIWKSYAKQQLPSGYIVYASELAKEFSKGVNLDAINASQANALGMLNRSASMWDRKSTRNKHLPIRVAKPGQELLGWSDEYYYEAKNLFEEILDLELESELQLAAAATATTAFNEKEEKSTSPAAMLEDDVDGDLKESHDPVEMMTTMLFNTDNGQLQVEEQEKESIVTESTTLPVETEEDQQTREAQARLENERKVKEALNKARQDMLEAKAAAEEAERVAAAQQEEERIMEARRAARQARRAKLRELITAQEEKASHQAGLTKSGINFNSTLSKRAAKRASRRRTQDTRKLADHLAVLQSGDSTAAKALSKELLQKMKNGGNAIASPLNANLSRSLADKLLEDGSAVDAFTVIENALTNAQGEERLDLRMRRVTALSSSSENFSQNSEEVQELLKDTALSDEARGELLLLSGRQSNLLFEIVKAVVLPSQARHLALDAARSYEMAYESQAVKSPYVCMLIALMYRLASHSSRDDVLTEQMEDHFTEAVRLADHVEKWASNELRMLNLSKNETQKNTSAYHGQCFQLTAAIGGAMAVLGRPTSAVAWYTRALQHAEHCPGGRHASRVADLQRDVRNMSEFGVDVHPLPSLFEHRKVLVFRGPWLDFPPQVSSLEKAHGHQAKWVYDRMPPVDAVFPSVKVSRFARLKSHKASKLEKDVLAAFAKTMDKMRQPLAAYCMLSSGPGILFAETILKVKDVELHVFLPCCEQDWLRLAVDFGLTHIERFKNEFGGWARRFRAILKHSRTTVHVVDGGPYVGGAVQLTKAEHAMRGAAARRSLQLGLGDDNPVCVSLYDPSRYVREEDSAEINDYHGMNMTQYLQTLESRNNAQFIINLHALRVHGFAAALKDDLWLVDFPRIKQNAKELAAAQEGKSSSGKLGSGDLRMMLKDLAFQDGLADLVAVAQAAAVDAANDDAEVHFTDELLDDYAALEDAISLATSAERDTGYVARVFWPRSPHVSEDQLPRVVATLFDVASDAVEDVQCRHRTMYMNTNGVSLTLIFDTAIDCAVFADLFMRLVLTAATWKHHAIPHQVMALTRVALHVCLMMTEESFHCLSRETLFSPELLLLHEMTNTQTLQRGTILVSEEFAFALTVDDDGLEFFCELLGHVRTSDNTVLTGHASSAVYAYKVPSSDSDAALILEAKLAAWTRTIEQTKKSSLLVAGQFYILKARKSMRIEKVSLGAIKKEEEEKRVRKEIQRITSSMEEQLQILLSNVLESKGYEQHANTFINVHHVDNHELASWNSVLKRQQHALVLQHMLQHYLLSDLHACTSVLNVEVEAWAWSLDDALLLAEQLVHKQLFLSCAELVLKILTGQTLTETSPDAHLRLAYLGAKCLLQCGQCRLAENLLEQWLLQSPSLLDLSPLAREVVMTGQNDTMRIFTLVFGDKGDGNEPSFHLDGENPPTQDTIKYGANVFLLAGSIKQNRYRFEISLSQTIRDELALEAASWFMLAFSLQPSSYFVMSAATMLLLAGATDRAVLLVQNVARHIASELVNISETRRLQQERLLIAQEEGRYLSQKDHSISEEDTKKNSAYVEEVFHLERSYAAKSNHDATDTAAALKAKAKKKKSGKKAVGGKKKSSLKKSNSKQHLTGGGGLKKGKDAKTKAGHHAKKAAHAEEKKLLKAVERVTMTAQLDASLNKQVYLAYEGMAKAYLMTGKSQLAHNWFARCVRNQKTASTPLTSASLLGQSYADVRLLGTKVAIPSHVARLFEPERRCILAVRCVQLDVPIEYPDEDSVPTPVVTARDDKSDVDKHTSAVSVPDMEPEHVVVMGRMNMADRYAAEVQGQTSARAREDRQRAYEAQLKIAELRAAEERKIKRRGRRYAILNNFFAPVSARERRRTATNIPKPLNAMVCGYARYRMRFQTALETRLVRSIEAELYACTIKPREAFIVPLTDSAYIFARTLLSHDIAVTLVSPFAPGRLWNFCNDMHVNGGVPWEVWIHQAKQIVEKCTLLVIGAEQWRWGEDELCPSRLDELHTWTENVCAGLAGLTAERLDLGIPVRFAMDSMSGPYAAATAIEFEHYRWGSVLWKVWRRDHEERPRFVDVVKRLLRIGLHNLPLWGDDEDVDLKSQADGNMNTYTQERLFHVQAMRHQAAEQVFKMPLPAIEHVPKTKLEMCKFLQSAYKPMENPTQELTLPDEDEALKAEGDDDKLFAREGKLNATDDAADDSFGVKCICVIDVTHAMAYASSLTLPYFVQQLFALIHAGNDKYHPVSCNESMSLLQITAVFNDVPTCAHYACFLQAESQRLPWAKLAPQVYSNTALRIGLHCGPVQAVRVQVATQLLTPKPIYVGLHVKKALLVHSKTVSGCIFTSKEFAGHLMHAELLRSQQPRSFLLDYLGFTMLRDDEVQVVDVKDQCAEPYDVHHYQRLHLYHLQCLTASSS